MTLLQDMFIWLFLNDSSMFRESGKQLVSFSWNHSHARNVFFPYVTIFYQYQGHSRKFFNCIYDQVLFKSGSLDSYRSTGFIKHYFEQPRGFSGMFCSCHVTLFIEYSLGRFRLFELWRLYRLTFKYAI